MEKLELTCTKILAERNWHLLTTCEGFKSCTDRSNFRILHESTRNHRKSKQADLLLCFDSIFFCLQYSLAQVFQVYVIPVEGNSMAICPVWSSN